MDGAPDQADAARERDADPRPRRRWWTSLRDALRTPAATLALGLALVADAWIVAHTNAGGALFGWLGGADGARAHPVEFYAVREPAAGSGSPARVRLIVPDLDSWDELGRWLRESPGDVVRVTPTFERGTRGVWAATSRLAAWRLEFEPFGHPWPEADRLAARRLVAAALDEMSVRRPAGERPGSLVRDGDTMRREVVWHGHLHNIVAAALLAGFIVSLGWVPRAPGWWRARRRARALARGRCPACGYALAGLEGGRCPECGGPI